MSDSLARLLATDPSDVGCGEAMAALHVYVDLMANRLDPGQRYPGVAAHLAACGPCFEDFQGLLIAVVADGVADGGEDGHRPLPPPSVESSPSC